MFSKSIFKKLHNCLQKANFAVSYSYCDDDDDSLTLIEQADAAIENQKSKIKPPMNWENIKNSFQNGSVNSFDGFRTIVQKQVNLNTVVSHFYWLGSQAVGPTFYQYRLILVDEDRMLNVATDMDFNIEIETKGSYKNATFKANSVLSEQQKNFNFDTNYVGNSSVLGLAFSRSANTNIGFSYIQSVTPSLQMAGYTQYNIDNGKIKNSFAAVYDDNDQMISSLWDKNLRILYMRRVNPNRVHLFTDLHFEDNYSKSKMSIGAEYTLKQSKVSFSIDSDALIKSVVEASVSPGMQLQLSSEVQQSADIYRIGFGLQFQ